MGAYHHSEVPQEDTNLTHVGPRTPCGEYLRRFWHPVALSSDLKDLPVRVRILGEDLVLFRDFSGRVGLLELHCSHRGTSLEFGLVSQRGIRCCYHGWLYDVDGTLLETPGEPRGSTLKERFCHGAYPTVERNGLVFAYMGPPEHLTPFPTYDTFNLPGYRIVPLLQGVVPCNWLQIKENSMDPIHLAFLHTIVSGSQFTEEFGVIPEIDFEETALGLASVASRRLGEFVWVRINDLILPTINQVPPLSEDTTRERMYRRPMMTIWTTPIDDTNTVRYAFMLVDDSEKLDPTRVDAEERFAELFREQSSGDRPYERRQRTPTDYDAQVSQRPIAVHALEHLSSTDRGVVMFRRMVAQGIKAVAEGRDPKGIYRDSAAVIPTYGQHSVVRVPPASTPEADLQLLRRIGRKVLEASVKQLPGEQMRRHVVAA
jgi:nitrite reductase/ring-hydroxylating ferredoxin subunit